MIVHIVSRAPESLVSLLRATRFGCDMGVEVRGTTHIPALRWRAEQTLVVVDLSDPPAGNPPPSLQEGSIHYLLVVDRQRPVAFPWVEFAKSETVQLVSITRDSADPFAPLIAALERMDTRLSPRVLTEAIIQREQRLWGLEDLVSAVLSKPWRVRLPTDLAVCVHTSRSRIHMRCEAIGLKRVEHFITLVRCVAFEVLTGIHRMPAKRARVIAGIGDPSNFRRQSSRLRYYTRAGGESA